MPLLSKPEIGQLQQLMKEDGWEILLRQLADYIDKVNAEKVTGANEFESLRMLHTNQGRVDGLTEFFDKLDKKAFE